MGVQKTRKNDGLLSGKTGLRVILSGFLTVKGKAVGVEEKIAAANKRHRRILLWWNLGLMSEAHKFQRKPSRPMGCCSDLHLLLWPSGFRRTGNEILGVGWAEEHVSSAGHVCACGLSRFSCVWLFVVLWTAAHQAPLSMGFSRQKYWSGLPCCPPGDLPNPGTEPVFYVCCFGRLFLYHCCHLGNPKKARLVEKFFNILLP